MTRHSTATLADVCQIVQGGRQKLSGNDFVAEGFPAYGAGGMNGHLPNYEFDRQAVILSSIGARCGKCFFVDGKWNSLANTQIILPDPKRVDARFLWFQLNDEARWPRSGSAQPFIKPSDVKGHRVVLPPLPEQRRIAAILDHADALRAKRRAALAQLDEMAQAIFVEMFGNPAVNPFGFPLAQLRELGKVSTGATPPGDREGMFGGEVPFVTPGDLGTSEPVRRTVTEQGASAVRTVRRGAALVCCIGATIGKMDKARDRSAFNQQINAVEWNDRIADDYGLRALMFLKEAIVSAGTSTTLPILKKSSFEQIKVPVPPMRLQAEYVAKTERIESLRATGRRQAENFDALYASLQHRAFNGEL